MSPFVQMFYGLLSYIAGGLVLSGLAMAWIRIRARKSLLFGIMVPVITLAQIVAFMAAAGIFVELQHQLPSVFVPRAAVEQFAIWMGVAAVAVIYGHLPFNPLSRLSVNSRPPK